MVLRFLKGGLLLLVELGFLFLPLVDTEWAGALKLHLLAIHRHLDVGKYIHGLWLTGIGGLIFQPRDAERRPGVDPFLALLVRVVEAPGLLLDRTGWNLQLLDQCGLRSRLPGLRICS